MGELPIIDFERVGPPVGVRLPDVVLSNQHGKVVDLHAVRAGRPGLFVVYRSADW